MKKKIDEFIANLKRGKYTTISSFYSAVLDCKASTNEEMDTIKQAVIEHEKET